MVSKFNTFDSILSYLREASISPAVVTSTTTPSIIDSSHIINNGLKSSSKKQRKEKDLANVMSTTPSPQPQLVGEVQSSAKGRVRYGPITVNPRKQPSKTLFTGRRSKYEVLSTDEEERRRERRDRNRVAATKCREKRDNVLSRLEIEHNIELDNNKRLVNLVNGLKQRKNHLESTLTNHMDQCPLINNAPQSSMIFGDTNFLSSIPDTLPPPLPSYQLPIFSNEEEEISHILDPNPVLTNSAYNTDESNPIFIPPQPQLTISMTNSSLERLFNNYQPLTPSMDNHSSLFNSAFGLSCAKQHSSSSEDDSLPPKRTNPYVC